MYIYRGCIFMTLIMKELSIYFNKTEMGFEVAIGDDAPTLYAARNDAWNAVYNSLREFDFTNDRLLFNGLAITSIERLVALMQLLF